MAVPRSALIYSENSTQPESITHAWSGLMGPILGCIFETDFAIQIESQAGVIRLLAPSGFTGRIRRFYPFSNYGSAQALRWTTS